MQTFDFLQHRLSTEAHETDAFYMKKYLKNLFEFYGVKTTPRRAILKEFYQTYPLPTRQELAILLPICWQAPKRELHHCGMEIAEKVFRKSQIDDLQWIEYMITHQSWWDTVDFIATKIVGNFFKQYPSLLQSKTADWLESNHLWLQRTAIICQLGYKKQTNVELLFENILYCSKSKEFFIQKAIGWALREYSKTDAQAVKQFVTANQLKPLSQREALRKIK